ncbi:hypothetical protein ACFLKB_13590 [Clostridium sp. FAM 1755]|uniref:hypothetical protein n=1 Tax=Clostridium caseinilyticum TaxID=3350403 RepID=UPI0038F5EDDB
MKKVLVSICGCLVLVGILSNVVFAASSTSYKFRLPTHGNRYTSSVTKPNRKTVGYNYASYVGWKGSGINCWVKDQSTGKQITSTSSYTNAGTVKMYYGPLGRNFYGHAVSMGIKTDLGTWHPCDVKGRFLAS